MSAHRWPALAEISSMDAVEAYDLYWGLPGAETAHELQVIRALGDHAWTMRQQEDAGKPKRQFLPMPEVPAEPVPAAVLRPSKPRVKTAPKPAPQTDEEPRGGALFFLAGLKP